MANETPLIDVGGALKISREKAGLSQWDLFEKSGLLPGYISRIERGEIRYPRLSTIKKLCKALGIQVDEFINQACDLVCENFRDQP